MIESVSAPFRATEQSFPQRLKETTAPQHRRLESQPLLQALMSPDVSADCYGAYLSRMKKVAGAYEEKVLPLLAASPFPFFPTHIASLLIAEDLRRLLPSVDEDGPLPVFGLPENISLPFAWGFAYVMEGSKLGGKVIAKHLQKTRGILADNGGAYLVNAGADTGREWKGFLQSLAAYTAAYRCEEEVIHGAIFGFTSVHEYFDANE